MCGAGTGDHGIQRDIMNFSNGLEIIHVIVSLENRNHLAGVIEDLSNRGGIADAIGSSQNGCNLTNKISLLYINLEIEVTN